ncbi:MAG: hypothetical protein WBN29_10760 [Polyangiales bacterium]
MTPVTVGLLRAAVDRLRDEGAIAAADQVAAIVADLVGTAD